MSTVDQISALIRNAEDLETRAGNVDRRLLEDAAKAYAEATKLAEKYSGSLSEQTLNLRERWADSVRNSGNLAEATTRHLSNVEWTLENLKRQQRQKSSREDIALAQERHLYAQRQLAETYLESRKFSQAISLYEDILNSKADRSAEALCRDRGDLASALFSSGSDRNIMRAVNLNAETVQKAEKSLGRSHIETVRIRYNLAKELYSLGKYEDASEKFKEQLRILEAEGCQARSSPDYHSCLQDTKTSLRNCSTKIARQQEERRKAERIRGLLQDKVGEKEPAVKERNEPSTSTQERDTKNQGPKPRKTEPPKVQESRKPQMPDVATQPKNPSGTTDREKKQEKQGKDPQHRVGETSSKTKQQEKPSDSIKEEKRVPNQPRRSDAREGPKEQQSSTKQKADNPKDIPVATLEVNLTNESSRGPPKRNSKFEAVSHQRVQDISKFPTKSEAKRDLPTRPHSAAEALSPHSTTKSESGKVQRSNSTRSDVSRSKRIKDHDDDLVASKDSKVNEKSKRQKESASSAPRNSNTQQEKTDSKPTKPREKQRSSSASTIANQSADRKSKSDVTNRDVDTPSPSTSKAPESNREIRKEKQDKRESSRNDECSNERKPPRAPSAPSIILSEPGHRKETPSSDSTKPRHRSLHERERPRSSQSHYRESPSPLDIVNKDIAVRKERRSRSSDSERVPLPSKTDDDLEVSKNDSNSGKSRRRNTLLMSAIGAEKAPSQSSEKPERKESEKQHRDLTEPSTTVVVKEPVSDLKPAPVEDNLQQAYSWVDAREYFEPTNQPNEDVQVPPSVVEPSPFISTLSDAKHGQSKPLETIAPPEPVSVISIGTVKAEHIIPGGWHQDFDEPDLNQKVRKSRSNDGLSQGGLRVSQPSNVGHRRAASVDISRPASTPARVPHINDWSHLDEIKADEWLDNIQRKTHVFLDKYRDDCYGVTKSARRVRIAVLDTGVAKSTAKGPVPSLMKGPRVKIGKILDPSLPWNMDTRGHGTHAAGLILTVCPYADLYVYRVCDGHSHIDKKHVADAILDAVDKKKVDIISMSLGWDSSDDELEKALLHARANNVLIFAASSNEGLRTKGGMAFPARALEVIAIDAADVDGRPLGSNPTGTNQKGGRLTALGQAVRSTWPLDLSTEDPEAGWKRLAGTSCATPIAAGIAGLVLEFARQRPMCFEQKIERHLKKVRGMYLTLQHLLSVECDSNRRFRNLDPTELFRTTRKHDDGGDWAESFCPRSNAASRIVQVLMTEYGDDIGLTMSLEIAKEMGRRHLESSELEQGSSSV